MCQWQEQLATEGTEDTEGRGRRVGDGFGGLLGVLPGMAGRLVGGGVVVRVDAGWEKRPSRPRRPTDMGF